MWGERERRGGRWPRRGPPTTTSTTPPTPTRPRSWRSWTKASPASNLPRHLLKMPLPHPLPPSQTGEEDCEDETKHLTAPFFSANFVLRKLLPWPGTDIRGAPAPADCCYQPPAPPIPPVWPALPPGWWSAKTNLVVAVVVSSRSSRVFSWAFWGVSPWASLPTGIYIMLREREREREIFVNLNLSVM